MVAAGMRSTSIIDAGPVGDPGVVKRLRPVEVAVPTGRSRERRDDVPRRR